MIVPQANHRLEPGREPRLRFELRPAAISVVLVQLETPLKVVAADPGVCRELGLRLILDPAPAQPLPDALWPGVFAAKPNESEAAIMTGVEVHDTGTAVDAGRWFLDRGVRWP